MEAALAKIQDLVSKAALSVEVQRRLRWALDQLPPLYRDLARTYDVRYRDGILHHVHGMLRTLEAKPVNCPDAPKVMDGLVRRLLAMHTRLGIPGLGLKAPAPAKPSRKRKVS